MQVIVFRDYDGVLWCGQCIERDIAVQARTLAGINRELVSVLRLYREFEQRGKRGPGRPPDHVIRRPGHRIRVAISLKKRSLRKRQPVCVRRKWNI